MQYIQYIESSQEWTCPKTGRWKVIVVGGGAGGGGWFPSDASSRPPTSGAATSFGSIIAVQGGKIVTTYQSTGGMGGYTGFSYGGAPGRHYDSTCPPSLNGSLAEASTDGVSGTGYGAGGGSSMAGTSGAVTAYGTAGEIKITIVDLNEGQKIACTVGVGGINGTHCRGTRGKDGVIIVEYLGASF